MNKKAGFTLIEILTVITMIVILASVVLVSLETARNRARDITIQKQIGELRVIAEASHSLERGYEDISATGHPNRPQYDLISAEIAEMEGSLVWARSSDGRSYCAFSRLRRNTDQIFCVDSTGMAEVLDYSASGCRSTASPPTFTCRASVAPPVCLAPGQPCTTNAACCSLRCGPPPTPVCIP